MTTINKIMEFSSLESRRYGSMCSRHVYQCVFTVLSSSRRPHQKKNKKYMVRNAIRQLTITFNLNWSAHIFQTNREWTKRLHEVFCFVFAFSRNSTEMRCLHFANKFVRIVCSESEVVRASNGISNMEYECKTTHTHTIKCQLER